ncbi:TPA: hypothetical protein EYP66_22640 [Candidatus Poribacteria bacterium]|nr:hypothetical protein [Candidatus Poribacteria bacterium]
MIWKENGGKDTIKNLIAVCRECHRAPWQHIQYQSSHFVKKSEGHHRHFQLRISWKIYLNHRSFLLMVFLKPTSLAADIISSCSNS